MGRPLEISKVAFARAVVDLALEGQPTEEVLKEYYESFAPLLELINSKQRVAIRLQAGDKVSTIVKRLRRGFIDDHPADIKKSAATALLENIVAQLPSDPLADRVLDRVRVIQRDFKLADEPRALIMDPDALRAALLELSYEPTNAVQEDV
jgi:hypothetical protein